MRPARRPSIAFSIDRAGRRRIGLADRQLDDVLPAAGAAARFEMERPFVGAETAEAVRDGSKAQAILAVRVTLSDRPANSTPGRVRNPTSSARAESGLRRARPAGELHQHLPERRRPRDSLGKDQARRLVPERQVGTARVEAGDAPGAVLPAQERVA